MILYKVIVNYLIKCFIAYRNTENYKRKFFFLVVLPLFSLLIYSCSPIPKLAKKYIKNSDSISILLLENDTIFSKNERYETNGYTVSAYDDGAIAQTKTLKNVQSDKVKTLIYQNLVDNLKKFPFRLYQSDSVVAFMAGNKESFIVNIVQIELIEFDNPFKDSQQYDTITYFEDFLLNSISINVWFEISMLNNPNESTQLVFYSSFVSEAIDGKFRKSLIGNDVKYTYKRYPIDENDVYDLGAWMGEKNAQNIFDFFLNRYIYMNYSAKPGKYYYVTYDQQNKKVKQVLDDRFIFMKSKSE